MSEKSNKEIIEQAMSGGPDNMDMNLWSEDATLFYPGPKEIPYAGEWKGRDRFMEFLTLFYKKVETQKMEYTEFLECGDKVIIRGYTDGKVKETGKTFSSQWLLVWTMKDGQVIDMYEYQDTHAIARAFQKS